MRSEVVGQGIPFAEGLKATVQWYEDNRDWWQRLKHDAVAAPTAPGADQAGGAPQAGGGVAPAPEQVQPRQRQP